MRMRRRAWPKWIMNLSKTKNPQNAANGKPQTTKMETLNRNQIYNMDCLDGIAGIPSNSTKLIVTDPPYFLGMTHNGQRGSFVDLAICKPFYKQLFREYRRILQPDGEVYFFCDWRGYAFYYPLFDAEL